MPVVQIDLGLTAIEQLPGLCGPACAQMVLHRHPGTGIGTSDAEQRQLWQDIQAKTSPPSGHVQTGEGADPGDCGTFRNKLCECKENPFCWCTFPTALKAVLRLHAPDSGVRVIASTSEESIQKKILLSLRNGIAPIVLVFKGKHWVVVGGYDSESDTPVKLFDPRFSARREVALDRWVTSYLVAPTCGKYDGKHVIVGKDS